MCLTRDNMCDNRDAWCWSRSLVFGQKGSVQGRSSRSIASSTWQKRLSSRAEASMGTLALTIHEAGVAERTRRRVGVVGSFKMLLKHRRLVPGGCYFHFLLRE